MAMMMMIGAKSRRQRCKQCHSVCGCHQFGRLFLPPSLPPYPLSPLSYHHHVCPITMCVCVSQNFLSLFPCPRAATCLSACQYEKGISHRDVSFLVLVVVVIVGGDTPPSPFNGDMLMHT